MLTAPDTVPAAGAVMETVGGVVSPAALLTFTVTPADVPGLPAASLPTAVSVWLPFETPAVFHENE
jgi:hypothetical protein